MYALFKYGTHIMSKLVLKPNTREFDQNYQPLKLSTEKLSFIIRFEQLIIFYGYNPISSVTFQDMLEYL